MVWDIYGPRLEMVWAKLWPIYVYYVDLIWAIAFHSKPIPSHCFELQSNLDYPDSLGQHEIVRIIEGPDNREYEY